MVELILKKGWLKLEFKIVKSREKKLRDPKYQLNPTPITTGNPNIDFYDFLNHLILTSPNEIQRAIFEITVVEYYLE